MQTTFSTRLKLGVAGAPALLEGSRYWMRSPPVPERRGTSRPCRCARRPYSERARNHGVPGAWLDCAPFKTKLDGAAEQRCIQMLRDADVDTVVLAGFMIVKPGLLALFRTGCSTSIPRCCRPSLACRRGRKRWRTGQRWPADGTLCGCRHGHRADHHSAQCAGAGGRHPESLHARIQVEEHAYPEALRLLSENRLTVTGRRVVIS